MARYSGSGWHLQHTRHSNARKYGKAGGTYVLRKKKYLVPPPAGSHEFLGGYEAIGIPLEQMKLDDIKHILDNPSSFGIHPEEKEGRKKYKLLQELEKKLEKEALNDETMKELTGETDEEYAERIDNKCDVHIPQNIAKKHFGEPEREYGFDLTDFKGAVSFKSLLKKHGLTKYRKIWHPIFANGKKAGYYSYSWSNKDGTLELRTGNNPITGAYSQPKYRENEKGYASYMGIKGNNDKVMFLVDDIKTFATSIKGENDKELEFIW